MVTALRNLALFGFISLSVHGGEVTESNWPSFRGPQASGRAEGFTTPETWDVEKGQNLKWKTAIPGLGHSSPVIWGNQLFVTTAVKESAEAELKVGLYGDINPVNEATKHSWILLCLNKTNGHVLWQQTAHEGMPTFQRHPKSSHANSTPATDGQHLVCFFGSEGLFCFDMRGKQLWQKNLGALDAGYYLVRSAQWGFGSSPVIHNGLVIVQCDVQTNSFLAAFDVNDGRELWRTSRTDVPTWSTPTILTHQGRAQVVVNGYKHVGGYDAQTGQELWKLAGGGDIPVPTPVVAHGLIFITSAHGRMAPIYAVRAGATGDITLGQNETRNDHIVWSQSRRGNYMQTPLVAGEHLYCCNDAGVLACYLARTGENLYSERLGPGGSGFTASGVAADGKLYFSNENGLVYVVKTGPRLEVIATNSLGETCMASPALSEGKLFFRTRHQVVAVGAE
ncbi:MAG: PQQ-binding-like beta-propeller repeat protein [Verrucomicrobiota bacterium]